LDYAQARYYDPEVARFSKIDPFLLEQRWPSGVGTQEFNPGANGGFYQFTNVSAYVYSNNNPILYNDPAGTNPHPAVFSAMADALSEIEADVRGAINDISRALDTRGVLSTQAAASLERLKSGLSAYHTQVVAALDEIESVLPALVLFAAGQELALEFTTLPGRAAMPAIMASRLQRIARAAARAARRCNSFDGKTPVLTQNGLISIESISIGDQVWAEDPNSGESGWREVLATSADLHYDAITLTLSKIPYLPGDALARDTCDLYETITTTPNHPFHSPSHGWIDAGNLEIGDALIDSSGSTVWIHAIESVGAPIVAYNLTVDGIHTYTGGVGGYLVHNTVHVRHPLVEALVIMEETR
jgi:RHS repeat-associated protein